MNLEAESLIPRSIQQAYDISIQDDVRRLSGGLVNDTLIVEQPERTFVLRKLAPILGRGTVENTCIISDHLASSGWEAPTAVLSTKDKPYTADETGRIWHAVSHIPSDQEPKLQYDGMLALEAGQLLGSWHRATASLTYTPESLPHFHETDYIANKLRLNMPLLERKGSRDLAELFLASYQPPVLHETEKSQIIHGDPKLNNMLFRDGRPFTLIDFDCVLLESVWTDVGDFLRSLGGKLEDTGQEIAHITESFIKGYLDGNETRLSVDEATNQALWATQRIACELGMRYLSDMVDGENYFSWDQETYRSRGAALYDKALLQYQVMQAVNQSISKELV